MFWKTVKYYLVTNSAQRQRDKESFADLQNTVQEKRKNLESIKTDLARRGGCMHRYLKILAEAFPGKIIERYCDNFWIFDGRGCNKTQCEYYAEYVLYRDAYLAYVRAQDEMNNFWDMQKTSRINAYLAYARAQDKVNDFWNLKKHIKAEKKLDDSNQITIDTLDAQCTELYHEYNKARVAITGIDFVEPGSVRPAQNGCFIEAAYSSKSFDVNDDCPDTIITKNECCPTYHLPCTKVGCPYTKKNQHYFDVRTRYAAALVAYRVIAGREWKLAKER